MGKNTKQTKNVFKVAGAKSLKKTKSKEVNLGLKNIKKKIEDVDAQFVAINKNKKSVPAPKVQLKKQKAVEKEKPTPEDINRTADKIVKMDI